MINFNFEELVWFVRIIFGRFRVKRSGSSEKVLVLIDLGSPSEALPELVEASSILIVFEGP
ncbi:15429_t:CDS:2 [Dentiscutata erythropus]|uniref:15429_t:CDS:1 n=1 Tax=Dentiscutata erythropus TaxID=1348616 RepID=A0A9N9C533_9GLOM|nr:15429_t:CDS:2 [Dentiscutata erythropus]